MSMLKKRKAINKMDEEEWNPAKYKQENFTGIDSLGANLGWLGKVFFLLLFCLLTLYLSFP